MQVASCCARVIRLPRFTMLHFVTHHAPYQPGLLDVIDTVIIQIRFDTFPFDFPKGFIALLGPGHSEPTKARLAFIHRPREMRARGEYEKGHTAPASYDPLHSSFGHQNLCIIPQPSSGQCCDHHFFVIMLSRRSSQRAINNSPIYKFPPFSG